MNEKKKTGKIITERERPQRTIKRKLLILIKTLFIYIYNVHIYTYIFIQFKNILRLMYICINATISKVGYRNWRYSFHVNFRL